MFPTEPQYGDPPQPSASKTQTRPASRRRIVGPIGGLSERVLALTFDDGPHPHHTATVLDALKKHDAKATFFLLGENVARYPKLLRRMVEEGHAIGSHSWSHPSHATHDQAVRELERTHQAILKACGVSVRLFRPPYGIVTGSLEAQAKVRKYTSVLWSVDTMDWRYQDAARIVRVAGEGTRRGDIVLMHDIHRTTAQAVPRLLAILDRRQVRAVTIPYLLDPPASDEAPAR